MSEESPRAAHARQQREHTRGRRARRRLRERLRRSSFEVRGQWEAVEWAIFLVAWVACAVTLRVLGKDVGWGNAFWVAFFVLPAARLVYGVIPLYRGRRKLPSLVEARPFAGSPWLTSIVLRPGVFWFLVHGAVPCAAFLALYAAALVADAFGWELLAMWCALGGNFAFFAIWFVAAFRWPRFLVLPELRHGPRRWRDPEPGPAAGPVADDPATQPPPTVP